MKWVFTNIVIWVTVLFCTCVGFAQTKHDGLSTVDEKKFEQLVTELDSIRSPHTRYDNLAIKKIGKNLNQLIKLHPNEAKLYHQHARYEIIKGSLSGGYNKYYWKRIKAAENDLYKGRAVDPSFDQTYILFGHVYFLTGELEKAKLALKKAESLGTIDPWFYLNSADIYAREEKHDEAYSYYQKGYDLKPKRKNSTEKAIHHLLYKSLYDNDIKKAKNFHLERMKLSPNDERFMASYAKYLLCSEGDIKTAMVYANKSLSIRNTETARKWLAGALYLKWVREVDVAKPQIAQPIFDEAFALYDQPKELEKEYFCSSLWTIKIMMGMINSQDEYDKNLGKKTVLQKLKPYFWLLLLAIVPIGLFVFFILLDMTVKKKSVRIGSRRIIGLSILPRLANLLFIPLILTCIYIAIAPPPDEVYFWYGVVIIISVVAVICLYHAFLKSFRYDDEYVYFKTIFTKEKQLPWLDLSEVSELWYNSDQYLKFSGFKTKLNYSMYYDGYEELIEFLLTTDAGYEAYHITYYDIIHDEDYDFDELLIDIDDLEIYYFENCDDYIENFYLYDPDEVEK
ncbi:MAG: hypothetical protein COA43_04455 [Robiginitomaculum sp.]|nr:MAG: hypothetical protein COA43_04455 [Robiginitomaculum sp.]